MKRPTSDQWMGVGLAVMVAGVLLLAVLDKGGLGGSGLLPVGEPMPAIFGTLIDGEEVTFAAGDTSGQVLLLDFWASWCPACVRSMPSLARLKSDLGQEGFELLTINMDEARSREDQARVAREALAKANVRLPVLLDDGRLQATFKAYTLPTLYLVGRDGTIRAAWAGAPPRRTLSREIRAALSEGAVQ